MLASYPIFAIIALVYHWQSKKSLDARRSLEAVNMAAILLSCIVFIQYLTEWFTAWNDGYFYEQIAFLNRALGHYYYIYILLSILAVLSPQLFWFKRLRRMPFWTILVMFLTQIDFWFERCVIIIISLHRDFLPSSWSYEEVPLSVTDWGIRIAIFIGLVAGLVFFFRNTSTWKIQVNSVWVIIGLVLSIVLILIWCYGPMLMFLFSGYHNVIPGWRFSLDPRDYLLIYFVLPALFCLCFYWILRRFGKEE